MTPVYKTFLLIIISAKKLCSFFSKELIITKRWYRRGWFYIKESLVSGIYKSINESIFLRSNLYFRFNIFCDLNQGVPCCHFVITDLCFVRLFSWCLFLVLWSWSLSCSPGLDRYFRDIFGGLDPDSEGFSLGHSVLIFTEEESGSA